MSSVRDPFVDAALALAWSHWTGLGVRGTERVPDTAIDPEALIYFTMALVPHDARLLEEISGWWARFQRHISRSRLGSLARVFDSSLVERFRALESRMTGTSAAASKSSLERLDLPAHSLLRLRCIFGLNARAEVLLALLTQWGESGVGATAAALSEVGYSKRNVAVVLEELRLGGLVVASTEANRWKYRLADASTFKTVVKPVPAVAGRWHLRFPILSSFLLLAERLHGKDAVLQAIEARKMMASHSHSLDALGLAEPAIRSADAYWDELKDWLVRTVMFGPEDSSRRVRGMMVGVWFRPGQEPERPARFFSGVLPMLGVRPESEGEIVCLDLIQVPAVTPRNEWSWAVLSEAGVHTYEHSSELSQGQNWCFATWDLGGLSVYRASLTSTIPPARIAHAYGDTAASLARKDRPAVQLSLRRVETATRG